MGKRLRSLASKLWDTDSSPSPKRSTGCTLVAQHGQNELQLENEHLKQQVQRLQAEIHELKQCAASPQYHQHGNLDLKALGFKEPWIDSLRHDCVNLTRVTAEILPDLLETDYCNGKIIFDIPKNPKATASQVAKHHERCVSKLSSKHPAVFKIGITGNPVARWRHSVYGYCRDREDWQGMLIMSVSSTSFAAALLETMLISIYRDTPGCRNQRPGGETASDSDGPYFTYVVFKELAPPPISPRVVSCAQRPA